jgi:hypothetical protein
LLAALDRTVEMDRARGRNVETAKLKGFDAARWRALAGDARDVITLA